MKIKKLLLLPIISFFAVSTSFAETRITYKSAKSTSSYYQMAVQIADTIKKSTNGDMILTIEESQGSVQNVKEVAGRKGNYVFTTPPVLVKLAIAEKAMFKGKGNPKFKNIRAAVCYNIKSTRLSRQHNNANVISIGARLTKTKLALKCVEVFFKTKFESGRHLRRVKKI